MYWKWHTSGRLDDLVQEIKGPAQDDLASVLMGITLGQFPLGNGFLAGYWVPSAKGVEDVDRSDLVALGRGPLCNGNVVVRKDINISQGPGMVALSKRWNNRQQGGLGLHSQEAERTGP